MEEEKVRWRSLKKYPCKKGKGEHDFEFVSEDHFIISKYTFDFYTYKCKVCNKKIIKSKKI